jgi:hypothetical protein
MKQLSNHCSSSMSVIIIARKQMKTLALIFVVFLALVSAKNIFKTILDDDFILSEGLSSSKSNACPTCCKTLEPRAAQNYIFHQKTGVFTGGSGKWAISTKGYSGNGKGRLNPAMQCVKNVGVLPANTYKLTHCQDYMHGSTPRPCSFVLTPTDTSKMCGRNDFLIHGCQCCTSCDKTSPPCGSCSAGCIVINENERKKLRVGDTLHVVAP